MVLYITFTEFVKTNDVVYILCKSFRALKLTFLIKNIILGLNITFFVKLA